MKFLLLVCSLGALNAKTEKTNILGKICAGKPAPRVRAHICERVAWVQHPEGKGILFQAAHKPGKGGVKAISRGKQRV
jgi:hypothetical protein